MKLETGKQLTAQIRGVIARGLRTAAVDEAGHLCFTLTDGTVLDLGSVVGPAGAQGPRGQTGSDGRDGADGRDFTILGYYAALAALQAAVTSPNAGDAYGIGAAAPYDIYVYDGVTGAWVNNGALQGVKGDKGDKGDAGTPGKDGANGTDGTTPAIGANGNWYLGSTDTGKPSRGDKGDTGAKGEKGDTGAAGAAGKTPVKGTDYFTAADKAEIVSDVLAALPTWTGGSY